MQPQMNADERRHGARRTSGNDLGRRAQGSAVAVIRVHLRSSAVAYAVRGFTLIEMLVAIGIFIAMGAALVSLMHLGLDQWQKGERRRRTYEQAQAALGQMALDLEAAYTREPLITVKGLPMARFFCTRDAATGAQRLSFVRTFETGPERAFTFEAGGGGTSYTDGFTGDPRSLTVIGGLLGVSYFLGGSPGGGGRELRRATLGPPASPGSSLLSTTGSQKGEVLIRNVLYLGFRFQTQTTTTWKDPPVKARPGPMAWRWPERVWDSTRGADVEEPGGASGRRRPFALARGPDSLMESYDDIFPELVEVTIVVEPDEAHAVRTDLVKPASETDSGVRVASTSGFVDPSMGTPYLLIGGSEWVRYKAKDERSFELSGRGLRGTVASAHPKGATVRAGTTFVMCSRIPGYRADWTSDVDFRRKVRE